MKDHLPLLVVFVGLVAMRGLVVTLVVLCWILVLHFVPVVVVVYCVYRECLLVVSQSAHGTWVLVERNWCCGWYCLGVAVEQHFVATQLLIIPAAAGSWSRFVPWLGRIYIVAVVDSVDIVGGGERLVVREEVDDDPGNLSVIEIDPMDGCSQQ
jgi:hypothetical protein